MTIKNLTIQYPAGKEFFFSLGDSMLYDSGFAPMWADAEDDKGNKFQMRIAAQGCVKVYWRDNCYKCSTQMPQELLDLIAAGKQSEDPTYDCIENNWWELLIDKNGKFQDGIVLGFEPKDFTDEEDLKEYLLEFIQ